ncbi:MAG: enoyl-CoA hydratase/isomerase family protein [Proteobacteria bacterium]|nr:enoyl-CoA hydratase/isomerase family protein [Pseudomonadota bacterium]
MSRECFEVSVEGKVAHIRLSRPERLNVMTLGFWREIPEIARELDARGDVRAAVISSTGKHFTAGMDLSVFQGGETLDTNSVAARGRFRQKLVELQQSFSALADARYPVIAAVQGGCIGGGVDLATACCLRYATTDAYFVIQEINIGMMADVGTFNRMPKQLPEAVVRELGYTGDKLGAERAERLGFVNGLFDTHEALVEGALAVAKRIASKAPVAVAATKQMISYTRDHSVAESFEYMNVLQPGIFSVEDIQRAVGAAKTGKAAEYEDLPPKQA